MTAKEFIDSEEWTQTAVHFSISDVIDLMQEYARIKCLETIKNTKYAVIDIVCQDEVIDEVYAIQNIPNEEVMPEL